MIALLPETTGNTLVVNASGKLTAENYETVFIPLVEKLIKQYGQVRLVLQFDDYFTGMEVGAMWDDAKFGLQHRKDFKRIAVVGAPQVGGVDDQSRGALDGGRIANLPANRLP